MKNKQFMNKLTYTKKDLQKEARKFSIYYGREELMSRDIRKRYDEFCEKCRTYEHEVQIRAKKHIKNDRRESTYVSR